MASLAIPQFQTLPHSRTIEPQGLIGLGGSLRAVSAVRGRVFQESSGIDAFELGQIQVKGLILAQNERWRRGLGMQVVRERFRKEPSKVAEG